MSKPKKRRLYIVGGKGRNVPPWLSAAFDYEQIHQDHTKTRTLEPQKRPDAVVVMSSWIGHEHFYGARDLAERLDIPLIISPGGWSTSIKSASDLGVEWFISEIEAAKRDQDLTPDDVESIDEHIDNAWREAYNREWSARKFLEKRFGELRKELEHHKRELTLLKEKEAAAQRVISEVRSAAIIQRTALEKARSESEQRAQETQARSERISNVIAQHIETLVGIFRETDAAHQAVTSARSRIDENRKNTLMSLDILRNSLAIAEEGPPDIDTADTTKPISDTVSASNTESGS